MRAEPQLAGEPGIVTAMMARARSDRRFFTGMSVAALLIVFAGFARTYYLKGHFSSGQLGATTLSPLLHVHGALFTSWILLFLSQTTLIAAGRTDLHRRLGIAGAAVALAMPLVGVAPAFARLPGIISAGPPAFFGLTDLLVIACLVYDRVSRGRIHPAFLGRAVRHRVTTTAPADRRHRRLARLRHLADELTDARSFAHGGGGNDSGILLRRRP